ncbi:MAG: gliding motility-associated C-terminal domain-containing protein [Paramuribaculum sp.]|nr:gliding motility-associated C-terminal domain-containing protein [Paramuribaculum sp.]
MMKLRFITLILMAVLAIGFVSRAASVRVEGSGREVITEVPAASTGIDKIFTVFNLDGCKVVYTASSPSAQVTWSSFGYMGAAQAVEVSESTLSRNGAEITFSAPEGDTGYVVNENGKLYYFWIVDYAKHYFHVDALTFADEQECDRTFMVPAGEADKITYYSINGRAMTLSRDIPLTYSTLEADREAMRYNTVTRTETLEYLSPLMSVQAPLCNTYFTLGADRFLRKWGLDVDITSPLYTATAVDAITDVNKRAHTAENEIKPADDSGLGGSAPLEVEFVAVPTDAAIFTQWEMSPREDFEDISYSNQSQEFEHTFYNQGTTYVRFRAADASGNCEYISDVYIINIGESSLKCPNAFSPKGSPGVNDEWRVSYKSIVDFECYIFNRWGEKLAEFHDPSKGWDGKRGGKYVPAGVYYYVIKAKGSDGKEYNLSGDINIVNYE